MEDLTVVTNPNTKLTTGGQFDPEEFLQQMKVNGDKGTIFGTGRVDVYNILLF